MLKNNKEAKILNKYVGFIGFDTNNNMVYKLKDTLNERSTGARCDQSGKLKNLEKIMELDPNLKNENEKEIGGLHELCVRQELLLRLYQKDKYKNKLWFVDPETAIINEFEKKERINKKK